MNGLAVLLYSLSLVTGFKTVTSPSDSIAGSLRAAIESAGPGDTVRFSIPGQDTLSIQSTLSLKKDISIDGRTNSTTGKRVIINLDTLKGAIPAIDIGAAKVRLQGMEIRGGVVAALKSKLFLDSVVVRGARGKSAGIKSEADTLVLSNCLIAANAEGGVIQDIGILIIDKTQFTRNTNSSPGAGVYLGTRGTAYLRNSSWLDNRSTASGGALSNHGKMEISDCEFVSNEGRDGGGIGNHGTMHIDRSKFFKNEAWNTTERYRDGSKGGAVFNSNDLVIKSSSMDSNYSRGPSDGSYLSGWGGIGFGGAVYNQGNIRIDGCAITANGAIGGGAGYGGNAFGGGLYNTKEMLVENSTIRGNLADGQRGNSYGGNATGGGFYNSGRLNLVNTTVTGNTAKGNNGNPFRGKAEAGGISNTSYVGIIFSTLVQNKAWIAYGENNWGPFDDDIGNGDSLALVNSIVFGLYRDSLNATGKALNTYLSWGALPENSRNSLSYISEFDLFGNAPMALKDNGGPTLTFAIDDLSVARASGIPVGICEREEKKDGYTWKYSIPAYFDGAGWRTVEKDSAVATPSVRVITRDQRGFIRPSPPSRGAYEFGAMAASIKGVSLSRKTSMRHLGIQGNRVEVSLPDKADAQVSIFDMRGRRTKVISRGSRK